LAIPVNSQFNSHSSDSLHSAAGQVSLDLIARFRHWGSSPSLFLLIDFQDPCRDRLLNSTRVAAGPIHVLGLQGLPHALVELSCRGRAR